jgi:hypothetical protein
LRSVQGSPHQAFQAGQSLLKICSLSLQFISQRVNLASLRRHYRVLLLEEVFRPR